MQSTSLTDVKKYTIFESLYDDHTLSTISKFGIFYSRLFKATYFFKALEKTSINCSTSAALYKLAASSQINPFRTLDLLQFHSHFFAKTPSTSTALLSALMVKPSVHKFLSVNENDIFDHLESFTLEELALRNTYKAETIFE